MLNNCLIQGSASSECLHHIFTMMIRTVTRVEQLGFCLEPPNLEDTRLDSIQFPWFSFVGNLTLSFFLVGRSFMSRGLLAGFKIWRQKTWEMGASCPGVKIAACGSKVEESNEVFKNCWFSIFVFPRTSEIFNAIWDIWQSSKCLCQEMYKLLTNENHPHLL